MDPITPMILTALTAGAAGIAAGTLQEIGRQAYDGLKNRVIERFKDKADVESALATLETKPESAGRQATLQEELEIGIAADPDAESDADLRDAVQKLLDILEKDNLPTTGAVNITLKGDGAIAQGDGAVAAGKRGVAIGGNVKGSTIISGDKNNSPDEK